MVETIHLRFVGGGWYSAFTQVEHAISVKGFATLYDDRYSQYRAHTVSNDGCVLIITALLWKETPWKPPWKRQGFGVEDASSLLYGDIRIIAENWESGFLFLSKESIYWVLNRRIFIDLARKLANVIQQGEFVFGIVNKWVITKDEDRFRLETNMWKRNNIVNTLLAIKTFWNEASLKFTSV
ncbi:unnamed protein product, partial [Arabis nemorensis]